MPGCGSNIIGSLFICSYSDQNGLFGVFASTEKSSVPKVQQRRKHIRSLVQKNPMCIFSDIAVRAYFKF